MSSELTKYSVVTPNRPDAAFVAGMQEVGYTADEMRLILADNFTRVFGMPKIVLEDQ